MVWLAGAVLAMILATVAVYFKLLTVSGGLAAFLVGFLIYGLGQVGFSIPIIVFFVSSSMLSFARKRGQNLEKRVDKSGPRNASQVFANGLLPAVLLIGWRFNPDPKWVVFFITALASSTADTWATEIGMLASRRPIHILNWKRIAPGESGGITWLGSFGGALGAVALVGTAAISLARVEGIFVQVHLLALVAAAFLSQFLDSLMGATMQVRYKCLACGIRTEKREHCKGAPTEKISGLRWMTNDAVNIASVGFTILVLAIFI